MRTSAAAKEDAEQSWCKDRPLFYVALNLVGLPEIPSIAGHTLHVLVERDDNAEYCGGGGGGNQSSLAAETGLFCSHHVERLCAIDEGDVYEISLGIDVNAIS